MGKITFWLETKKKYRKNLKKQIVEYCLTKDYGYRVDEIIGLFVSHMDVKINVPDKDLLEVMSLINRWKEMLQP